MRRSAVRLGRGVAAVVAMAGLAVPPVPTAGPAPRTLAIDPARSALGFTVTRPGETIDGTAHDYSGEVVVDPERPGRDPSVTLRVVAASLETGNRMRDRKMRKGHLEADRFPEIAFRSTSIRLSEEGTAEPPPLRAGEARTALVEGILALHGVERPVLFPATIRYDDGSLTAEGNVSLRLTDHAIPIPRFLWIVLDDEVKVHFRFAAGPKPAAAAAEAGTDGSR